MKRIRRVQEDADGLGRRLEILEELDRFARDDRHRAVGTGQVRFRPCDVRHDADVGRTTREDDGYLRRRPLGRRNCRREHGHDGIHVEGDKRGGERVEKTAIGIRNAIFESDVATIDVVWNAAFAAHVEDLSDLFTDAVKADIPLALLASANVGGKTMGVLAVALEHVYLDEMAHDFRRASKPQEISVRLDHKRNRRAEFFIGEAFQPRPRDRLSDRPIPP